MIKASVLRDLLYRPHLADAHGDPVMSVVIEAIKRPDVLDIPAVAQMRFRLTLRAVRNLPNMSLRSLKKLWKTPKVPAVVIFPIRQEPFSELLRTSRG